MKTFAAPAAALVAAGVIGGLAAVAGWEAIDPETVTTVRETAAPRAIADTGSAAGDETIADVVERVLPSVVEIRVGLDDSRPRRTPRDSPFDAPQGSAGSGWVYDDEGHVVTNQHVVGDAERATVVFHDGEEVQARVVGRDRSSDVAVLELEDVPRDVDPLPAGSTESLRIGDPLIAIGSPMGLEGTVTTGIVSALDRNIDAPNGFTIDGAVQTDAALNSGNSGGPLLDASGRVVGMNAQIESRSGGNDGIGYAVPIETVQSVTAELLEDGEIEYAYLGVAVGDAEDGSGAEIGQVVDDSPADRAGLRSGDVVIEADGEKVDSGDALREVVSRHRPGDELELRVRRGDGTQTITVELGTRPPSAS